MQTDRKPTHLTEVQFTQIEAFMDGCIELNNGYEDAWIEMSKEDVEGMLREVGVLANP
jgi:hypothetical protein